MSLHRSTRFFSTLLVSGLVSAAMGTLTGDAEAQVLRFSKTAAGAIASTGNTLGLSKATNSNGPGLANSIGTFISLDPLSVDDTPAPAAGGKPWGASTTSDWTVNGSTGVLDIPDGAEILYAELVWAGSFNYGGQNLTDKLDLPISLSANSDAIAVDPDSVTSVTVSEKSTMGFDVNYYMRSGEVTPSRACRRPKPPA